MRTNLRPTTASASIATISSPGVPLVGQIEARDLMLATLHRKPFSQDGWIFELKYDGYRCLVKKRGDVVQLVSRPGNSLDRSFLDIVAAVAAVPGDFVWDAELTVDEANGRPSFKRLQSRAATSVPLRVRAAIAAHPARLYLFDVLAAGSRDLRGLPLDTRKQILRDSFDDTKTLVYASGIVAHGQWVFEQAQLHCLEGMVAKRRESTYHRGRSAEWLKIKNPNYDRPAALGIRGKREVSGS